MMKKKDNDNAWSKGAGKQNPKLKGLWFCSRDCLREQISRTEAGLGGYQEQQGDQGNDDVKQKRQLYIDQLQNLRGWSLLTETEQNDLIEQINTNHLKFQ